MVYERIGYAYACSTATACQRTGVVGTYPYPDWCVTYACHGGNSTCGDQFGQSNPTVWACEACEVSCNDPAERIPTLCPDERGPGGTNPGGCYYTDDVYGGYQIVPCVCE
jgi:hypothetical protein